MTFYLTKDSTLPTLRMELIEDGRHDFNKFHESIQAADIKFTMVNADTNVTKIARANAYVKLREGDGCTEQYVICYDWKTRDTKEPGNYKGMFEINFGELTGDDTSYPSGTLNMPIREDLNIIIR